MVNITRPRSDLAAQTIRWRTTVDFPELGGNQKYHSRPLFPGGASSYKIEHSIEDQAKQKTAVDLHGLGDHRLVHLLRMMHQRMHDRSLASDPRRDP